MRCAAAHEVQRGRARTKKKFRAQPCIPRLRPESSIPLPPSSCARNVLSCSDLSRISIVGGIALPRRARLAPSSPGLEAQPRARAWPIRRTGLRSGPAGPVTDAPSIKLLRRQPPLRPCIWGQLSVFARSSSDSRRDLRLARSNAVGDFFFSSTPFRLWRRALSV